MQQLGRLQITCRDCGEELPATFATGERCPRCAGTKRRFKASLHKTCRSRFVRALSTLRRHSERIISNLFSRSDLETPSYSAVGQCVYCGTTVGELSTEHIIPYGLSGHGVGGEMTLPAASCSLCRDVTSNIERIVLRGELQHVRAILNLKTRRKSERPKTYPISINRNGTMTSVEAPLEDHPIILPMPVFLPPAFLDTREYDGGVQVTGYRAVKWGPDPEDVARKYGVREISISVNTAPAEFARMLGKIGYSYAVAELGPNAFNEILVLDATMGKKQDIGRWVGSSAESITVPLNALHYLQIRIAPDPDPLGRLPVVLVDVKLFASSPVPTYTVVVGTLGSAIAQHDKDPARSCAAPETRK
jgi:hypothetical protein